MARKTLELVTLTLRLREGLRKKLEKAAKTSDVSMNQEILDRLEYSFERERQEARDSAIVDTLVRSNAQNRWALEQIMHELANSPKWHATPEGVEAMAERIGKHVRDFGPGGPWGPSTFDLDEDALADMEKERLQGRED
jgi:hypothetical protein